MKIDRDALNYSRICSGKRYSYAVCEDGTVLRTQHSNMKESRCKVTLINGRAFVYIGRIAYKIDSLVAKHFIPGYKPRDVIEHIDGNPLKCAVWNLRVIPRAEYNTGRSRNGLAKPIEINGETYPSIQSAAKALFVDQSTLHNYLRGKYNKTMLDGTEAKLI
jgi:hypothetical protein